MRTYEVEVRETTDNLGNTCVLVELVEYWMFPVPGKEPRRMTQRTHVFRLIYPPNALFRVLGDTLSKRIERAVNRLEKQAAKMRQSYQEVRQAVSDQSAKMVHQPARLHKWRRCAGRRDQSSKPV